MLQFEVIVMIVRLGTEADFLYVYLLGPLGPYPSIAGYFKRNLG